MASITIKLDRALREELRGATEDLDLSKKEFDDRVCRVLFDAFPVQMCWAEHLTFKHRFSSITIHLKD